jgi:hypothetical protein
MDESQTIVDQEGIRGHNLSRLAEGQVSYSQFIDIENTPNLLQLKEAFYRGIAYVSKPLQSGVDLYIPIRVPFDESGISYKVCENDTASKSSSGVHSNANSSYLETVKGKEIERNEESLPKILEIYNLQISDLVDGSDDFWYTALCVQCKNQSSSRSSDDYGIDLVSSGVATKSIPCLSVKHVLKVEQSSVTKMKQPSDRLKPYRHGIVIKGLNDGMLPDEAILGDSKDNFIHRFLILLDASPNPLIDTMDLEERLQTGFSYSAYVDGFNGNGVKEKSLPHEFEDIVHDTSRRDETNDRKRGASKAEL